MIHERQNVVCVCTLPAPGEMVCLTPAVVLSPLQPMWLNTGPYFRCLAFCMSFQLLSDFVGIVIPANCLSAARCSCPPKHLQVEVRLCLVPGATRKLIRLDLQGVAWTVHGPS